MSSILILALPLILVGVLFVGMGIASRMGRLPINSLIGIRIPTTLANERSWVAGHQAAAPWIILSGLGLVFAGIALLVTSDETGLWAMLGTGWLVLFIVVAMFVASHAARNSQKTSGRE